MKHWKLKTLFSLLFNLNQELVIIAIEDEKYRQIRLESSARNNLLLNNNVVFPKLFMYPKNSKKMTLYSGIHN